MEDAQLDLFAPATRSSDRATSHDAARAVARGTADIEHAIISAVPFDDRLIDEEIVERVTRDHGDRWKDSTIVTARKRVVDSGHLVDAGSQRRNRRGRWMTEWRRP